MDKLAYIFPGQGSQFVGMGYDFYQNYPEAKRVFDIANLVLNKDIKGICFNGPEGDLKQTINTQPAIVATSIAILEVFKSKINITPAYTAGHSLGEYCAMYASGVISLEDTFKLIQKRADLMSKVSSGSMAAVINAPDGVVDKVVKEISKENYIDVANYNSPVQVVLTGDNEAIEKAGKLLTDMGVKRYIQLPVSGAFHSKYMISAGEEFEQFVSDISISDAKIPVITNIDANETIKADDFRIKIPKQIYSSVHWTQTIQKMISYGVDTFIEIGPGKVLAGLNRKIDSEITTYSIHDKNSLEDVISLIRG